MFALFRFARVSIGESSPPRRANDVASTLLEGHVQSSSLFMSLMEASHRLCSRIGESARHVAMVLAFDLGFRSFRTNPAMDRFGFCWLCMPGSWIGNAGRGVITYRKARQPSAKGEREPASRHYVRQRDARHPYSSVLCPLSTIFSTNPNFLVNA